VTTNTFLLSRGEPWGIDQTRKCMYTLDERMFRRTANLLLSVLLTATLLWGGCVACPQYFQAPLTKKSCCTPTGQCKNTKQGTSQQKPCQFQQLELQKKLPAAVPVMAVALPAWHQAIALSALPQWSRTAEVRRGVWPESPHSKQALLSTFLI
jgi:hypothetical protein